MRALLLDMGLFLNLPKEAVSDSGQTLDCLNDHSAVKDRGDGTRARYLLVSLTDMDHSQQAFVIQSAHPPAQARHIIEVLQGDLNHAPLTALYKTPLSRQQWQAQPDGVFYAERPLVTPSLFAEAAPAVDDTDLAGFGFPEATSPNPRAILHDRLSLGVLYSPHDFIKAVEAAFLMKEKSKPGS